MAWHDKIEVPQLEQLRRIGAPNWERFVASAEVIADTITAEIDGYFADRRPRVLDFGCGIGRVFLPTQFRKQYDLVGCDIDSNAIEYLKRVVPSAPLHVTDFNPPLPFADRSFDCVYSVSIWTHLSVDAQIPWLAEMARILRPGGLALLTTTGHRSLDLRLKRGDKSWEGVTHEDLRRAGILYREYGGLHSHPDRFPGVTSSYGSTLHDPDFIRREWSKVMKLVAIKEAVIGIAKSQDLVILVKE